MGTSTMVLITSARRDAALDECGHGADDGAGGGVGRRELVVRDDRREVFALEGDGTVVDVAVDIESSRNRPSGTSSEEPSP
jgi:hypothetical protein